jgi:hypothetical protein
MLVLRMFSVVARLENLQIEKLFVFHKLEVP